MCFLPLLCSNSSFFYYHTAKLCSPLVSVLLLLYFLFLLPLPLPSHFILLLPPHLVAQTLNGCWQCHWLILWRPISPQASSCSLLLEGLCKAIWKLSLLVCSPSPPLWIWNSFFLCPLSKHNTNASHKHNSEIPLVPDNETISIQLLNTLWVGISNKKQRLKKHPRNWTFLYIVQHRGKVQVFHRQRHSTEINCKLKEICISSISFLWASAFHWSQNCGWSAIKKRPFLCVFWILYPRQWPQKSPLFLFAGRCL